MFPAQRRISRYAAYSVSVVWALGDPSQREQIEAAHARAVERSMGYLKEPVPVVRRRYDGQVVEEHAKDVIADASNAEIDRLNARAQHLRAERGELGENEVPLPHQHYGLRQGGLITFTAQHRTPGQPRIENGSRGEVTAIDNQGALTVALDGSDRTVNLAGETLENLRLGYAQHVYRQQGATVERSIVVTGGWQTSKESAYVQASRAREGTEWFLAREELGTDGQDERRVNQLADKMRGSRAHTPSLEHRELSGPSVRARLRAHDRAEPQPTPRARAHHPPHRRP